ncbi:MAG: hypothetical protein ACQEWF_21390 [Bacillota bacterium]
MGCHFCDDHRDRRDDRKCCDWDKFLFGDRRRFDRRDNVFGLEDILRRCRRRRDDDEDRRRRHKRKCDCDFF